MCSATFKTYANELAKGLAFAAALATWITLAALMAAVTVEVPL